MVKTMPLRGDTHKFLKDIQTTLRNRYDINMSIRDLVARLIPDSEEEGVKRIMDSMRHKTDRDFQKI